jgi:hypothetical protein
MYRRSKEERNAIEAGFSRAMKALDDRDWFNYFINCPRRNRREAFVVVMGRLTDKEYWELLRYIWADTELPYRNKAAWLQLFTSPRGERESAMTEGERSALAALPDPCVAYRGVGDPRQQARGMSWTTDLATAAWFARRGNQDAGVVVSAWVPKHRIFYYCAERNESEVIIDPSRMKYEILSMSREEIKRIANDVARRRIERDERERKEWEARRKGNK